MARKNKKNSSIVGIVVVILLFAIKGNWHSFEDIINTPSPANVSTTHISSLAKLNYESGQSAVVEVNKGKSKLDFGDWNKNHVVYSALDSQNRTSTANIAYLETRNVADDSLRESQYVQPTGWHQKKVDNTMIINRGHLIAYSLSKGISSDGQYNTKLQSGDQNNAKNLFTQTAYSNQRIQTVYEKKVRDTLRAGHRVIYKAQAVFRGNELMARGVHLEAVSDDGSLNFNVYIFNVQPGVKFDYSSGRSVIDKNMLVSSN